MVNIPKNTLIKLIGVLVIVHAVLFFLNTDQTNSGTETIGRNQALMIINGQEYECDSVVTIIREATHVKVGCDVNTHYVPYIIYKDDYGFNKVQPM